MKIYKGKTESIKGPIIASAAFALMIAVILYFFKIGFGSVAASLFLFFLFSFSYKGIVLKIKIDGKKIVVVRPFTRSSVIIDNIAFCAVHGIDEGAALIYAFTKKRYKGIISVKGVRPKLPFQEIIRLIVKEESKTELDINFNQAVKLPIYFVEEAEELQQKILSAVSKNQDIILKGQS